ncbi:TerB family tellurite resistance protein [Salipiger sp. P9]|uniref:tellurite resistance TerB family protein n=1 Tax=Salipiger pentaromativorans TaxID=2943193 RepID=UPI00215785F4|nr:TerB family tellurite resistance protein [Salipiger pentaromativorans]MCR8549861.1 TerB family tellurite resistance protein [Salipiger pentaromativorans]
MFERLKAFFHLGEIPETPLPEMDAAHALGALLVKVAIADNAYLFEEVEQIDRILAEAYDLKPLAAAKMRAGCEKLAFETPGIEEMAARIREGVDYEHRRAAVEAMWKVVVADGISDNRETEIVNLIEGHLGLERADSEAARVAASIP